MDTVASRVDMELNREVMEHSREVMGLSREVMELSREVMEEGVTVASRAVMEDNREEVMEDNREVMELSREVMEPSREAMVVNRPATVDSRLEGTVNSKAVTTVEATRTAVSAVQKKPVEEANRTPEGPTSHTKLGLDPDLTLTMINNITDKCMIQAIHLLHVTLNVCHLLLLFTCCETRPLRQRVFRGPVF